MHSFYTPEFKLSKDQVRQIEKVLRIKENEKVYLFNKTHNCLATYANKQVKFEELNENIITEYDIDCYFPLLKNNNFKLIVQKTTEIGGTRIFPLITNRSVVKIDNEKNSRYEKIIFEAAEQSRNFAMPELENPIDIQKIDYDKYELVLVPYEDEHNLKLIEIQEQIQKSNKIGIIIGPEGGFTQNEIDFLTNKKNVQIVSLGKNILRAETAAINSLSIVKAIKE